MSNSSNLNFYDRSDTIAAIATPPGEGGVAIVRISGVEALNIAGRLFSKPVVGCVSHKALFGHLFDREGRVVDEVLLLPFLGGRSFTGEEVVEIQCHGGSLVARRILEELFYFGARAAQPGEFTFRAFMNGRIDLAQAEAVQQLIHARNEWAVGAAADQLCGRLSERITSFQSELAEIAALFEAWVDFPEEGLEFATEEEVVDRLTTLLEGMHQLRATFHDGRIVQEGLSLCIVGRPNVGKSSLMNRLLERDRAIVTDIPGTTRDLLEEPLLFEGLHLRLIDTAGIRESDELVEQEGIRRSHRAMEEADLVLLLLDSSRPLEETDRLLLEKLPNRKALAVWNKIDLGRSGIEPLPIPSREVSVLSNLGLGPLQEEIGRLIWDRGVPTRDQLLITQLRHKEALDDAILMTQKGLEGFQGGISPEFLLLDLRPALAALGRIIGTDPTEEILSAIFRRFCLGK